MGLCVLPLNPQLLPNDSAQKVSPLCWLFSLTAELCLEFCLFLQVSHDAGNSGILTLTQYCQLPESLSQASPPLDNSVSTSVAIFLSISRVISSAKHRTHEGLLKKPQHTTVQQQINEPLASLLWSSTHYRPPPNPQIYLLNVLAHTAFFAPNPLPHAHFCPASK